MAYSNSNDGRKFLIGAVAGGLAGAGLIAALRPSKAEASPNEGKEVTNGNMIIDFTQIIPKLDALLDGQDKELLFSPEKVCSLLYLNFPQFCFPVPVAFSLTLAPLATVAVQADVPAGFIQVFTGEQLATVDVGFLMSLTQLFDNNVLIYFDPGLVNSSIKISYWYPIFSRFIAIFTNTSALLNVSVHSFTTVFSIENNLFLYLKEKLRKLGLEIIPEEVFRL